MRILFISNLYPPHELGGMEQLCKEAVDRLRQRGHTCHVLTSRYGVEHEAHTEEGVTRTLYLEADINHYRPLGFFLRRPWHERANRQAVQTAVDSFEPDVIFVWGMWNLSRQVPYWAEQRLPGRVAYAVASYWLDEPGAHEAYWQLPASRLATRALMAPARWLALREIARQKLSYPLALQHVACVSEYVRQSLERAGALPHGARVIYNGIDPEPFLKACKDPASSAPHTLKLVYVGGILRQKGVHTAIEALGLLRQRDHELPLHLTLVGGGHPDYLTHLKRRVDQLDLESEVAFHGRVPRQEIPALLRSSDVFLFTSVWEEPIARSVMEAMAAGVAVVATPVGGQREMLVDGENALVFPPDDAEQLAECILRLSRDSELRAQLAEAGRRTVLKRFTLERMVDEIEAWLEDIVA